MTIFYFIFIIMIFKIINSSDCNVFISLKLIRKNKNQRILNIFNLNIISLENIRIKKESQYLGRCDYQYDLFKLIISFYSSDFTAPILLIIVRFYQLQIFMLQDQVLQLFLLENMVVPFVNNRLLLFVNLASFMIDFLEIFLIFER